MGRLRWGQGTTALGAGGYCPLYPLPWEAGGARVDFHNELCPFLLSCEGTFAGVVDSLAQETFSGGKPPDPKFHTEKL